MSKFIDLAGQQFGRWTVLALHRRRCRNGGTRWLCRCNCGTERLVAGDLLRRGESISCGCFQREVAGKQLIDLTGQRFGRWTVLAIHPERGASREAFWLCCCDCGTKRVVRGVSLRDGVSTSCGCRLREVARKQLIDLTGKRFGRWLVLAMHSERDAWGRVLWLCRCDCGTERALRGDSLRDGESTSCGCFQRQFQRKRRTTHGMSKTRVYQIWEGMKQRCLNPNNSAYDYYGGRGLGIYEDWHTFEGFYADVLDPPPGMSLDRTDNDADYAPWNWRWAPRSVQLANRRPYRRRRSKAGRK